MNIVAGDSAPHCSMGTMDELRGKSSVGRALLLTILVLSHQAFARDSGSLCEEVLRGFGPLPGLARIRENFRDTISQDPGRYLAAQELIRSGIDPMLFLGHDGLDSFARVYEERIRGTKGLSKEIQESLLAALRKQMPILREQMESLKGQVDMEKFARDIEELRARLRERGGEKALDELWRENLRNEEFRRCVAKGVKLLAVSTPVTLAASALLFHFGDDDGVTAANLGHTILMNTLLMTEIAAMACLSAGVKSKWGEGAIVGGTSGVTESIIHGSIAAVDLRFLVVDTAYTTFISIWKTRLVYRMIDNASLANRPNLTRYELGLQAASETTGAVVSGSLFLLIKHLLWPNDWPVKTGDVWNAIWSLFDFGDAKESE